MRSVTAMVVAVAIALASAGVAGAVDGGNVGAGPLVAVVPVPVSAPSPESTTVAQDLASELRSRGYDAYLVTRPGASVTADTVVVQVSADTVGERLVDAHAQIVGDLHVYVPQAASAHAAARELATMVSLRLSLMEHGGGSR